MTTDICFILYKLWEYQWSSFFLNDGITKNQTAKLLRCSVFRTTKMRLPWIFFSRFISGIHCVEINYGPHFCNLAGLVVSPPCRHANVTISSRFFNYHFPYNYIVARMLISLSCYPGLQNAANQKTAFCEMWPWHKLEKCNTVINIGAATLQSTIDGYIASKVWLDTGAH